MAQGVQRFLDCSTEHLTAEDLRLLVEWSLLEPLASPTAAPFRTISHAYGWFVHVPLDDTRDEREQEARAQGMGDAFFAVQDYARKHGCWWINFDIDA